MIKLLISDVRRLDNPAVYAELYDRASSERKSKADSFRFAKDRKLSLGATALLDRGLSAFGFREKDMEYGLTPYGKPFFLNAPDIHFSISHSSTKVAVAFSDNEVGCDIEEITEMDPEIVKRYFCRDEYEAVMAPESIEERRRVFFRYWVLKESYMKATGLGMSLPLNSFSVRGEIPGYSFLSPESFPGYECAVCHRPGSGVPEIEIVG